MIHTVKDFNIVSEAEVVVFLEFPCFSMIPRMLAIWSLIPPFSKPSLYIWKISVHVLLKPSLKDFEHYLAGMWNECNCVVVWAFFGIGMKTDLFQSCSHCLVFQICWHIECSTLHHLLEFYFILFWPFRILNSSVGIPSPPPALFIVMLPKSLLTSHSRMSGSRWVTTPSWLSRSLSSFFV